MLEVIEYLRQNYQKRNENIPEINDFFEEIKKFLPLSIVQNKDKSNHIPADLELMQTLNKVRSIFGSYDQAYAELIHQKLQEWLPLLTENQIEKYIDNLQKKFFNGE